MDAQDATTSLILENMCLVRPDGTLSTDDADRFIRAAYGRGYMEALEDIAEDTTPDLQTAGNELEAAMLRLPIQ